MLIVAAHVPKPVLKILDTFVHRVKFPANCRQSSRHKPEWGDEH